MTDLWEPYVNRGSPNALVTNPNVKWCRKSPCQKGNFWAYSRLKILHENSDFVQNRFARNSRFHVVTFCMKFVISNRVIVSKEPHFNQHFFFKGLYFKRWLLFQSATFQTVVSASKHCISNNISVSECCVSNSVIIAKCYISKRYLCFKLMCFKH